MRAVGLKVLKNRLSEYVRLAEGGETVLIADRDRIVAELVPPREGRGPALADAIAAGLAREGSLSLPRSFTGRPPPSKPVAKVEALLRELDHDRDDRT
ncbi:MAG: type II toxin-antitoxin system Phd/YefM family antitoxin [Myxococcales bacterium]